MDTIDNVAAEIDKYVDYVAALQIVAKEINAGMTVSPLHHFKDALWHYTQLYEIHKKDKNSVAVYYHVTSIDEHLYCGLRNICLYIIHVLKFRIRRYLTHNPSSYKRKFRLRCLLYDYKMLEIKIKNDSGPFVVKKIEHYIVVLKSLYIRTFDICRSMGTERTIVRGA
ncbi:hypothetical protein K7I13_05480 [Brucepastera parasyntrophica]|uniref:hypothetical protein n=1 Tax=Brucepastera parasyntrophica TaxID=2880008 RepID=UPI00210B1227|nr:hypothetical protein [Brucepastera parasyntrophica]ULQ60722.1 hypothetical protein K7I13_05480 [Brucepastera parasyntrophica]